MNTSKALELSMYNLIRNHCELGDDVLIRPWQSLSEDGAFDPDDDRHFPCLDIRFTAPQYNEDQVTLICVGKVDSYTKGEDDSDHQDISKLFESSHAAIVEVFRGACNDADTELYDEFVAKVKELDGGAIHIGGITLEAGTPPDDEGGLNVMGIGIGVHFSYK